MSRQWTVVGRPYVDYDEFGEVKSTFITVASHDDGYATYTENILGDHSKKSNTELIQLAKDQFFKKEYSDYAMNDAVLKVDELNKTVSEAKLSLKELKEFKDVMVQFMDTAKSDITSIAASQSDKFNELKSQFDVINNSFMELLTQTFGGDSDDTEYSEPDGSVPVPGDETVPVADGEAEAVTH